MARILRRLAVRVLVVASLLTLFLLIRNAQKKFYARPSKKAFSPSLDYPKPGERNIFFVETSCALVDSSAPNLISESGLVLPARVACALEAAARAHPERPVFYAHSCPLDLEALLGGAVGEVARAVFALPNVFLWPVRFPALFFGSPLQPLVGPAVPATPADPAAGPGRRLPAARASHLLRFLLLWRYGGTFLDGDVLVRRPFGELRDFACAEAAGRVSAAALDLSWEAPGRQLASACVNETLRPAPAAPGDDWAANDTGAGVVTRALRQLCGVPNASEAGRCGGVQVLPAAACFPVGEAQWRVLFEEGASVPALDDSFAVRLWGGRSGREPLRAASRQPAAQLARSLCPAVVRAAGDQL